ncbi:bifunctional response regulator/alkaline phosphatase family protein [bacterium]|nr:bifunctional response regulator/alkaline phosphatase family protein [bacterium]
MKITKGKILWVDDEIDHLKPHILFLEERGYSVTPVTNAEDAISLIQNDQYDLVLMDEMMPGMDGLEALPVIKSMRPSLPMIMVTKSEEENLMEEAIGVQIEDYLTKPVNPSQIFSTCKRILERQRISQEKVAREYTSEFGEISAILNQNMTPEMWIDIHIKLSERDLDLDAHPDLGLRQTLHDQKRECNQGFGKYIRNQYIGWLASDSRPTLSVDLIPKFVLPSLKQDKHVLFIIIDNLRLDQWLILEPILYDWFMIRRDYYFSILPTATPYSRNAIFSGLFPAEIEAQYPDLWKQGEDDEYSRNRYEHPLLLDHLERLGIMLKPEPKYVKMVDASDTRGVMKNIDAYLSSPLSAMVFNFVDIMAHRRSDSQILREIVPDESAFRSLTRTWFEHSALFQILKASARAGVKVVLTSDHGSIRCMRGSTVHADKETSTNVRYKYGRAIRGEQKHCIEVKDPGKFKLPARGINTNYLIALEDYYFVYPTNYHKYLSLYRDSFQHGGVSLEEMILTAVTLDPKS